MLRLTIYDYLLLGVVFFPIVLIFIVIAVSVWKDITGNNEEDNNADNG